MLNAAVIGLGTISPMHLSAISALPGVALDAVCDIDPIRKIITGANVPFYTDYHRLLEERRPDVVHICLPHYLHVPVAKAAAECGCHVFCEKPPAMDAHEMEEFVALERAHPELKLCVCFQNRYNRTAEELKRRLDSGVYGAVTDLKGVMLWRREVGYYAEKPWRGRLGEAGGGCLFNQAIHTIDLLCWLGGPVKSPRALSGQLLDLGIEVEDTAAASLAYESGARGFFLGTLANYTDEFLQLAVRTERAEFVIEREELALLTVTGREVLARDERLSGGKTYYGSGHFKLISLFYRAIETGGDDYIHVADAAESLRVADAIRRAGIEKGI